MRTTIPATILLLAAQSAVAQERILDGPALLEHCEKATAICRGFLLGVQDVTWINGTTDPSRHRDPTGNTWCLPKSVHNEQVRLIVVKWFKENPDQLHHTPGSLVAGLLALTFPCPAP